MEENKQQVLEVLMAGKDPVKWQQLREKLMQAINNSLDTVINYEHNTTLREEAKEFASALLDHAKSKLRKAGIENEKLLAEVDNLYVQRAKEVAATRKLNAEAQAIEIANTIKLLKVSLGGMKVILVGEPGEENLVFSNQIDAFLNVLKSIEG